MRYLNRIIFINSANVKFAEIAVDGNVHFIGTQGVGKSTLLRAILFFYNADKLKLGIEKGKKTFDEYYFPGGDSYIIYEVVRETGTYCIMAFKAQGRVCFRFINSAFQLEHYIADGRVKGWDGIRDSFGKKTGYTKKIDRYEEYRDILYGNNAGLEKEFRKYSLIESKQYQNLPRTIQNVFLNSKLDADFIKQTIIMSLNEEEVKIELDKYELHLRDFDTQLADINKWTETNKSGEIPVRMLAENIARLHAAIQSLQRERRETAIQLFAAYHKTNNEIPVLEKQHALLQRQLEVSRQKDEELKGKFQARRDEIQKVINILENNIKIAREKAEYYESINIETLIQRVNKKDLLDAGCRRLEGEKVLLNARFTEISSRYESLLQQQQNDLLSFENEQMQRKHQVKEAVLKFKNDAARQYFEACNEIKKQHQEALDVARNTIAQKKEVLNDLKLKKQKAQLQSYLEQETEQVKDEIADLKQKINTANVDIADHRKQAETLQKQYELEQERHEGAEERKIEKLREELKLYTTAATSLDAKLEKYKGSFLSWLGEHVPGWEENIGKVIDEDQVLFHAGLSPQLAVTGDDHLFGIKIDLAEIPKKVKTLAELEKDRADQLAKADACRAGINAMVTRKNEDADKLKRRFQGKIKEINDARRQMEFALQRAKGQLQSCEVKIEDLGRKALAEKEKLVNQLVQEMEMASEVLVAEEKNLAELEQLIQKQLDNREKEKHRKDRAEDHKAKELIDGYEQELTIRRKDTAERIAAIKLQQTGALQEGGADVARLATIDNELLLINRELEYINSSRDVVVEYNKDKREYLDKADAFKTEKRLKENNLDTEQEKFQLQKQKIAGEISTQLQESREIERSLKKLQEGLEAFSSFKLTDHFLQISIFEEEAAPDSETRESLKALTDQLIGKIYTINDRYSDLQSAINKFLGHFSSQNIFGFKTNMVEKEDFTTFAEMLNEFLEEDKIVQYEKRVNERFATLIRQIGKETNELTSKGGEIQKVITEINRDFEERNFAGVIKSIKLQLSDSQNKIVALLKAIKQFNDQHSMGLGAVNLFSVGDNEGQNKKAVSLLKEFAREINGRKEKEIGLPDSFELQFRIVENENDSGWVEKLTNVGSEGTDILVKAMINIMLLNVFKDSASKRFKDFRLHCMMDEIGKLHPNNVKGILKFANDRNIMLINSSPTSYNAMDYRYTYLLAKDTKNVTTVKRLIRKSAEVV